MTNAKTSLNKKNGSYKIELSKRSASLERLCTMNKLRILLVCGSGASSGFMAANMRKAALSRGLELSIVARGESEIENYIDDIDVLMVGPHLSYLLDETQAVVSGTHVKVILMDSAYYSTLDGEKAVEHLLRST